VPPLGGERSSKPPRQKKEYPMSYEILGSNGKYWTCHQSAWPDYLKVATAFGWAPEGAFFKDDEGGFRPHSSGSYLGNDRQQVSDDDARAFGASLHLAIATINAQSPMTDDQATMLKAFEIKESEPFLTRFLTQQQRAGLLKIEAEYHAAHPDEVRTIRTRHGTFDVNLRGMMDLAQAVSAGGFTIA
jgi:hypothetical protein